MQTDLLEATTLHDDDVVVLSCPVPLDDGQRARLVHDLEQALPDRRVIVLDRGMHLHGTVSPEWLERVEAKLDRLLDLLEDEPAAPGLTLDGAAAGAERDQTQPL